MGRRNPRGTLGTLAAVALLVAASTLPGCGRARPPSFVLVVVDTLRLDHLHFAGYPEPHTPAFDRLQQESVWFRRAWATSSWTIPSVASLLTSQYPSQHGVVGWGSRLGAAETTLAERLRRAGYATALVTANCLLSRTRGFDLPFEHYEVVERPDVELEVASECSPGPGDWVTARAMAWIRQVREADPARPFLAYVQYMEPHTPYRCAEGSDKRCRRTARRLARKLLAYDWEFSAVQREQLRALYADEVARMDAVLADLRAQLDASGVLDDAWLVLVADHGEHLGERGAYLHGNTLYQELVAVPMLFRPPGGAGGRVVDTPVSLVDVAPTLLELAGVARPDAFRGRSLAPALRGDALAPRPVVAEILHRELPPHPPRRHTVVATDGRSKLLMRPDGAFERVDLEADPGETRPQPADRAELERLLASAGLPGGTRTYADRHLPEPTPEMLGELRALGYAQ